MKFTKMHGCGNDYIYIDCTEEFVENEEKAAIILSDRHFGIGSDGLILIKPSDIADCEMAMELLLSKKAQRLILKWLCIMQTAQEVQCAATE